MKYLRLYGYGDTNFTTVINCAYPKTEIYCGIIDIKNH